MALRGQRRTIKRKRFRKRILRCLKKQFCLHPRALASSHIRHLLLPIRIFGKGLSWLRTGRPPITDASHLIVFAYKKTLGEEDIDQFIERIVEVRGQTRESLVGLRGLGERCSDTRHRRRLHRDLEFAQAYIALGLLVQTAAMLNIDATPMEGFDPAKVNEILELTDHSAVAIAAIGYRDAENDWLAPLPKVRKPKSELIERI